MYKTIMVAALNLGALGYTDPSVNNFVSSYVVVPETSIAKAPQAKKRHTKDHYDNNPNTDKDRDYHPHSKSCECHKPKHPVYHLKKKPPSNSDTNRSVRKVPYGIVK